MLKQFLAALLLVLIMLPAAAWYNDPGNDSCVTLYSNRRTYQIASAFSSFEIEAKVDNRCGAFTGNLGVFFTGQQALKVSVSALQQATGYKTVVEDKLDWDGKPKSFSYRRRDYVEKSLAHTNDVVPYKDFALKYGFASVPIPSGESFLKLSFIVPEESGEFVLTLLDQANSFQRSVLDPQWEVADGNLYAGAFTPGDIFSYDGTSTSAIIEAHDLNDASFPTDIRELCIYTVGDGNIVAVSGNHGGVFTSAEETSDWFEIGNKGHFGGATAVNDCVSHDNNLFTNPDVVGIFTSDGNFGNWFKLKDEAANSLDCLESFDGNLWSGGGTANIVDYWNGSVWTGASTGITGTTRAISFAVHDGNLFMGSETWPMVFWWDIPAGQ